LQSSDRLFNSCTFTQEEGEGGKEGGGEGGGKPAVSLDELEEWEKKQEAERQGKVMALEGEREEEDEGEEGEEEGMEGGGGGKVGL